MMAATRPELELLSWCLHPLIQISPPWQADAPRRDPPRGPLLRSTGSGSKSRYGLDRSRSDGWIDPCKESDQGPDEGR